MRAKAIFSRAVIGFISLWLVFRPSLPLSEAQAEAGRIAGDASLSSQASFAVVKESPGPAQDESTTQTDGISQILQQLQAEEYFVTWAEHTYLPELSASYQAPNRAQNLRTYFTAGGAVIIPRHLEEEGTSPWRWAASLSNWGRGEAKQPSYSEPLSIQENRVEYSHGELTEWYLNDESGLEQGFTVKARPQNLASGEALRIELTITTDLEAEKPTGNSGITWRSPAGKGGLKFGALHTVDANGTDQVTSLELDGTSLAILVADKDAAYPLQIVSLIINIGNTPYWTSSDMDADLSGELQVATAGDVNRDLCSDIMIGAPHWDEGGIADRGKVWILAGSINGVSTYELFARLGSQEGAEYGSSISTAGDVNGDGFADIIIGAPMWEDGETEEGAAWIHHGSYSGVNDVPVRYLQGNIDYAHFGTSVAFAGDVNNDWYSDVIIGASLYNNGQSGEGRVFVYHGSLNGIGATENWTAESNQINAGLGGSVSTAGDVNRDGFADIIVGAEFYSNGEMREGMAFIWHGSADGVNEDVVGTPANAVWTGEINLEYAFYGKEVSTAGDVNGDGYSDVIVGTSAYPGGILPETGAVWIYYGSDTGVSESWAVQKVGPQENDHFGESIAMAGDVNGDGYSDVIVGAPNYTSVGEQDGQAYLWYGHSNGIGPVRDWDAEGNAEFAHFGASVATAGDVNGDGYSEIIIAASGSIYIPTPGNVYVYQGGPEKPAETASWSKASNKVGALFGRSVSTAGDVNGDGYSDIIVGAPYYDAGEAYEGAVFVYKGSETGLMSSGYYWNHDFDQADANFGWSVAGAGDVNCDGYDDVIVGAPDWESGESEINEGGAWVFRGSETGIIDTPYWQEEFDFPHAQFGFSVAGAGDVNGDGCGDVIIGAPWMKDSASIEEEGFAFVYRGSETGIEHAPYFSKSSDIADAVFGWSVASAGDVNRDGLSDVIIGAPGNLGEGFADVYMSTPERILPTPGWHAGAAGQLPVWLFGQLGRGCEWRWLQRCDRRRAVLLGRADG